jgi:hypothetical protein
MNFETRQNRHSRIGKSLITIGVATALAGIIWRSQVRHTSLTTFDSTTKEVVQVETPHGRSNKRFFASTMIVGGAAIIAIGKVLKSESKF